MTKIEPGMILLSLAMSVSSIDIRLQGKPVRRMRDSLKGSTWLLKCIHELRSLFMVDLLCARLDSRLLHRPPHPLRDKFRERLDIHIDACPIERPQVILAVFNPDDGPRIAA
jgi:hypothetical protein